MFEGNGPEGGVQIGVERKTLSDLLTSLRDGRLQGMATDTDEGQLSRLRRTYDVVWLLVEGEWWTGAGGRLMWQRGRRRSPIPGNMTADALAKQLLTITLQAGVHVQHTANKRDSAAWLASLVRWWTDKQWEQHQTLQTLHQRTTFGKVSLFRERAMKLPDVGLALSKALEQHCDGSEGRLRRSGIVELSEVKVATPRGPRAIGLAKAERIVQALQGLE